jgi:hypothetical protein
MAPNQGVPPNQDEFPNMGVTQLYFVDTCRNVPEVIKNFDKLRTKIVFDEYLGGRDDRAAPVLFASVNDSVAYGEARMGSYFSTALIRALASGAEGSEQRNGRTVWPVSMFTLLTALGLEFKKLQTDQKIVPTGNLQDCAICYLEQAPLVDFSIVVGPDSRRGRATVQMMQLDGNFTWVQPNPAPAHPYALTPPAGLHRLSAMVDGSPQPIDFGQRPISQRNRSWQVQIP